MAFVWRMWRAVAVTGSGPPPRPAPPPVGCRRAVPPAGTGEARDAIAGRPGDGEGEGWGCGRGELSYATLLCGGRRKGGLTDVCVKDTPDCKVFVIKMHARGRFTPIGCAKRSVREAICEMITIHR